MKNKICEFCTNCRACEMSCPKNAISMKENDEGFYEPIIDERLCIDCGICQKRCPQNKIINNKIQATAYATQIKDEEILKSSTSGGFFSALALEVLKLGGIVFGASMHENMKVIHRSIKTEKELDLIRGSKYIVSDTNNTFKEAKEYLEQDFYVLYSGCPCQIAGLKSFLNKDYKKLITVDLICHGTPSYKLFDVYRKGMEEKLKSNISNYKFRDKEKHGWGVYWSFLYKNGKKKKTGGLNDNPYGSAFIKGFANKEACYRCKYVGLDNRPADVTLGDYWGIDQCHPEMASENGVSAVIINNKNMEWLIQSALKRCKFVETKPELIAKYNPSLIKTKKRPKRRDYVYDEIYTKTPKQFIKENLKIGFKDYLKTKIRLLIPYKLRVKIKKIRR